MSSCKSFRGFPLQSETSRIDSMLRAEIRFLRFYDVIVFTHVSVVFLANISVRILSTNKLISSIVKKFIYNKLF